MVDILQDLVIDVFTKVCKRWGEVGAMEIVSGNLEIVYPNTSFMCKITNCNLLAEKLICNNTE